MEEKKSINISIDNGVEFFSHELSVNYSPTMFTLDFKNITPRVDFRSRETPVLAVRHNVILIEPFHIKKVIDLLKRMVDNYEKRFGEIEMPKALRLLEKEAKKKAKKTTEKTEKKIERKTEKKTTSAPTYFG